METLCLVMPVYNEQDIVGQVVRKWHKALSDLRIDFKIMIYNDGSNDKSLSVIQHTANSLDRIEVIDKANGGHGQTILLGYRNAVAQGFDWIFQIDSDDEMGPESFEALWNNRFNHDFCVGKRVGRKQNGVRKFISLISRLCVRVFYGKSIWDVNSPYRLMRSSAFKLYFTNISDNTFAPNVILSGLAASHGLRSIEIPVPQRERTTGEVSLSHINLVKASLLSFWQTVRFSFSEESKFLKNCVNICLLLISVVFLYFTAVLYDVPETGDSTEYVAMTEQFSTRAKISFSQQDIQMMQTKLDNYGIARYFDYRTVPDWPKVKKGFTRKCNRYYSVHGFLYSVLASPIALVLRLFGANTFRAPIILNSIFLICCFWCCWLYFPGGQKRRIFALSLIVATPVVFYLVWPHTEVMSFSCIVMSLLATFKSRYKTAIFIAAIATSCNAAIYIYLFLLVALFLRDQYIKLRKKEKFRIMEYITVFAAGVVALVQPCYYYCVFGVPTLMPYISTVTGVPVASPEYMSFERAFSLFFDLNQGIILGSIPIVFLVCLFLVTDLFKRNLVLVWLPALSVVIAFATTSIHNWNPGGYNVSRYGSWLYAFLVFYVVLSLSKSCWKHLTKAIVSFLLIIVTVGQFAYNRQNPALSNQHSYMSKFMLDNFSSLYNPEIDIFVSRCHGQEYAACDHDNLCDVYAAYTNSTTGFITKILATDTSVVKQKYEICDESWIRKTCLSLQKHHGVPTYIDVPPGILR